MNVSLYLPSTSNLSERNQDISISPVLTAIPRQQYVLMEESFQCLVNPNGPTKPRSHGCATTTKAVARFPGVVKHNILAEKSTTRKSLKIQFSPQEYFNGMISMRGYSIGTYPALESAYCNIPTSSSNGLLREKFTKNRKDAASRLVSGCVKSPLPAMSTGESILRMVCRSGDAELFKVLLDEGCDVRVVDTLGRTLLHEACVVACWDVFMLLLEVDRDLVFMTDCHGATPLSLVPPKQWKQWVVYLGLYEDKFWPRRTCVQPVPDLPFRPPHSQPAVTQRVAAVGHAIASSPYCGQQCISAERSAQLRNHRKVGDMLASSTHSEDGMDDILDRWCNRPL